eukprot:Awhi_evm1s8578
MTRLTKPTQSTPKTRNRRTSSSSPTRSIKNMKNPELKKEVSTLRLELEKAQRSIEKAEVARKNAEESRNAVLARANASKAVPVFKSPPKGKFTNGNDVSLDENTLSKTETKSSFQSILDRVSGRSHEVGESAVTLRSKKHRKLRLRVNNRVADTTINDAMAISNSFAASVNERSWQNLRNENEATVLARIIDLTMDQFQSDEVPNLDFLEVSVRRLIAITHADESGNWDLAHEIEERQNPLLGPEDLIKSAVATITMKRKAASSPGPRNTYRG